MSDKPIFPEYFADVMRGWARETLEDEVAWVTAAGPFPTTEEKKRAKERVAKMDDETVFKILEATAHKPCPECGQ